MKYLLKLEALALFALALFLFSRLDHGWGWYALLFLAPDLSPPSNKIPLPIPLSGDNIPLPG